jgi:hypothetical protein
MNRDLLAVPVPFFVFDRNRYFHKFTGVLGQIGVETERALLVVQVLHIFLLDPFEHIFRDRFDF